MFYNLLYPMADLFGAFNLFRYLTFRSIGAFLTALVLSFLIGGARASRFATMARPVTS